MPIQEKRTPPVLLFSLFALSTDEYTQQLGDKKKTQILLVVSSHLKHKNKSHKIYLFLQQ